jgi:hypothetical protein
MAVDASMRQDGGMLDNLDFGPTALALMPRAHRCVDAVRHMMVNPVTAGLAIASA